MGKIKLEYDFSKLVDKALKKATLKMVSHVMKPIMESGMFEASHITIGLEDVKNWSIPIWTMRHKDVVMLRRFSTDAFTGTKYRFQIDNFAPNK